MSLDLSKSRTYYKKPDGTLSTSKSDAVYITADEIVKVASSASSIIPPGFFDSIAKKETGRCVNEEDFDYNADGSPRIHTKGLFQLDDGVVSPFGFSGQDLDDPGVSIYAFAAVMEHNLQAIADAAAKKGRGFDVHNPPADAWYYLALSHNLGLAATTKSIDQYGMSANEWSARNTGLARQVSYAQAGMAGALTGPASKIGEALASLVTDEKGDVDPGKAGMTSLVLVGIGLLAWSYLS